MVLKILRREQQQTKVLPRLVTCVLLAFSLTDRKIRKSLENVYCYGKPETQESFDPAWQVPYRQHKSRIVYVCMIAKNIAQPTASIRPDFAQVA